MLCVHYCLLLCSSEENNLVRKDLKNIFLLLWLDFRQKQRPKEKERGVCQFAKMKKAFFIFCPQIFVWTTRVRNFRVNQSKMST